MANPIYIYLRHGNLKRLQITILQTLQKIFCFVSPLQLLQKDPTLRYGFEGGTAQVVKDHPFFNPISFKRLEAGMVDPPFEPDVSTIRPLR